MIKWMHGLNKVSTRRMHVQHPHPTTVPGRPRLPALRRAGRAGAILLPGPARGDGRRALGEFQGDGPLQALPDGGLGQSGRQRPGDGQSSSVCVRVYFFPLPGSMAIGRLYLIFHTWPTSQRPLTPNPNPTRPYIHIYNNRPRASRTSWRSGRLSTPRPSGASWPRSRAAPRSRTGRTAPPISTRRGATSSATTTSSGRAAVSSPPLCT